MNLKNYDDRDDAMKVWLNREEVETFLRNADSTEQQIALGLAARAGLRTAEVVRVTPADLVDSPAGHFVRVWDGKDTSGGEGKYRESPVPDSLATRIEAYADVAELNDDETLIGHTTRTVRRWVDATAERAHAEEPDDGWQFLGAHDLRRSWGTLLCEDEVEPGLVMEWGGWDDWDTFREHYLGAYSVQAQREQREKVGWL